MRLILPIVEGHGEVNAVPALIRRVLAAHAPDARVAVGPAIRSGKGELLKPEGMRYTLELAARRTGPEDGILVVLDADRDLPCQLGPDLLASAARARPDRRTRVVVAQCEFEAWFLAGARSLRGKRDLPHDLEPPREPESIRDAKGWLAQRKPRGRTYKPAIDQTALAMLVDLEEASAARSFRKFVKEVVAMAREPG